MFLVYYWCKFNDVWRLHQTLSPLSDEHYGLFDEQVNVNPDGLTGAVFSLAVPVEYHVVVHRLRADKLRMLDGSVKSVAAASHIAIYMLE